MMATPIAKYTDIRYRPLPAPEPEPDMPDHMKAYRKVWSDPKVHRAVELGNGEVTHMKKAEQPRSLLDEMEKELKAMGLLLPKRLADSGSLSRAGR